MAANIRPFDASNVLYSSASTGSVQAAKPTGLALGDLWCVIHLRRVAATPESGGPTGFNVLGPSRSAGAHWRRLYWKIATAEDAAGEGVAWEQSEEHPWLTQSVAILGVAQMAPLSNEFVFSRDGGLLTEHNATGITPPEDGMTVFISSNSAQATAWYPPTTQGGDWTEYSQAARGSGPNNRLGVAIFCKPRAASEGPTGTITFETTTATECAHGVMHALSAGMVDPALLISKRQELRANAEAASWDLWRAAVGDSSVDLEKDDAAWAYADGTATTGQEDLITASRNIVSTLRGKLVEANAAYEANDVAALDAVTWN